MGPDEDNQWDFIAFSFQGEDEQPEPSFVADYEFTVQPADGLVLADDEYIIDPDYMEREGTFEFEQLIRTKR